MSPNRTNERARRATLAARAYTENIVNTPRAQRVISAEIARYANNPNVDQRAVPSMARQRFATNDVERVPRNVYMGLNEG